MKRIIGGAIAAGVAVFGGANAFDDNTARNDQGEIVESGGLGTFALRAGDCFQVPDRMLVSSVEAVPCTMPHSGQVYATYDLPDGPFPGDEAVMREADEGCHRRFTAFVGLAYEESSLDYSMLTPTMETWTSIDDREVVCVLIPMAGRPLLVGDSENSSL